MSPDQRPLEPTELGAAETLRLLRQRSNLTGTRLAEMLEWPQSKVSKVENGRQTPSDAEAASWARLCRASPSLIDDLLVTLEGERTEHRSSRMRNDRGRTAVQRDYGRLEHNAMNIGYFEMGVVPGLLQIPEYADNVIREAVRLNGAGGGRGEEIGDVVSARMARQPVLYLPGRHFRFLIGEGVLTRYTCEPEVMSAQLDRLLSAIGLRNVQLGILPASGQQRGLISSGFALFDDVAIVETLTSEVVYRGESALAYQSAFDVLAEQAWYGEAAREAIWLARQGLPVQPIDVGRRQPRLLTRPPQPIGAPA